MIKPKTVELYFLYECPQCNCEWQQTIREVKMLKGMVCNGCGAYSKFVPIEYVSVKPHYGQPKVEREPKRRNEPPTKFPKNPTKSPHSSPATLTPIQEDAILALTGLGFPKKEVKIFVAEHKFQSVEDYIQAAVRKGTR